MYATSTAFKNAIAAGNDQRVLLIFSDSNREFSNEDILMSKGIELNEEFNTDEDLSIGLVPSSNISFTLLNDVDQLADFEFGWFVAYLGVYVPSGSITEMARMINQKRYAFIPLGKFYAEKPAIIAKKTVAVTAYDQMTLLDRDMPSSALLGIQYPTTISDILLQICSYTGIQCETSNFLNSDLEVKKEPSEFSAATMREVVGWIAECACSNARFNRDGRLELVWFTLSTVKNLDESSYKEFTPTWYTTEAINGLYCRNTADLTEESEGTDKTNNYLIQDNPFLMEEEDGGE